MTRRRSYDRFGSAGSDWNCRDVLGCVLPGWSQVIALYAAQRLKAASKKAHRKVITYVTHHAREPILGNNIVDAPSQGAYPDGPWQRGLNLEANSVAAHGPLVGFRLCSASLPGDLHPDALAQSLQSETCVLCGTSGKRNLLRLVDTSRTTEEERPDTRSQDQGSAWLLYHYIPESCTEQSPTSDRPSDDSIAEPSGHQTRLGESMKWLSNTGLESQKRSLAEPRLWSLLDIMERFDAPKLFDVIAKIHHLRCVYVQKNVIHNHQADLDEREFQEFSQVLNEALDLAVQNDFHILQSGLETVMKALRVISPQRPMMVTSAVKDLHHVDGALQADLRRHKFVAIGDGERASFMDRAVKPATASAFPESAIELKEGNVCFALGVWTASAFHYMRAVDLAMKALHAALGASTGSRTLREQEWNKTIDQIDKKWKEIDSGPNVWSNPALKNARAFFKPIVADLHAFKDKQGDRNTIMHAGPMLDQHEAAGIISRVERWFELLSSKASESMPAGSLLDASLFQS